VKRRLSTSAIRLSTPPPSGRRASAANWPAPDQTTAYLKMAASGEMPAAAVLAPKMAPRIRVLAKKVRAARKPSRTFRGVGGRDGRRNGHPLEVRAEAEDVGVGR
jgi:hypothetical protein